MLYRDFMQLTHAEGKSSHSLEISANQAMSLPACSKDHRHPSMEFKNTIIYCPWIISIQYCFNQIYLWYKLHGVLCSYFHHWEKPYLHTLKNCNNFFTGVWDCQSAAGMSLTLFSAMNEWQYILFFEMWIKLTTSYL